MSAVRPLAPPGPRLPTSIIDAPTQRLYTVSLLLLLSAYKASDALAHSRLLNDTPESINTVLLKWVAIDLAVVSFVSWLRIPRLDWDWKGRWAARVALVALDWLLFGRWTFAIAFLLPSFAKNLLARALSTTESSVRLSSVYGKEKEHLGGQFTVHILALSTAFLNPLSTIYCRHSSKGNPTLIPLVLNNTVPAKLTYTISSYDYPPVSTSHTISASSLVRHPSRHRHLTSGGAGRAISNAEDDDLALASEWSLVPSTPSSSGAAQQQVVRHRLPADSPSSSSDPSDPFNLSPTESLYYLPITTLGNVRLDHIVDSEGHAIRIRRKRDASSPPGGELKFEQTQILSCPTAGFRLAKGEKQEEHRCLVPGLASKEEGTFPLGLAVSGQAQPLKLRWHSRYGDAERGQKQDESLEGIVAPSNGEEGVIGGVIDVPMNVSLTRAGRTTFYLDSVVDGVGNSVSYQSAGSASSSAVTTSGAPLVPGTISSRSVFVHPPPEVAFTGDCAKGDDLPLLVGGKKTLAFKISGAEQGEASDVEVVFRPVDDGKKGWRKTVKTEGAIGRFEVSEQGSYEVVGVKSRWCEGSVLVPNVCTLVLQPQPTLTPSFTPITDVCSSEIGLLSTLHLTGAPPFVVHYSVTRRSSPHSNRPSTKTYSKRITHSRDELRLEPPSAGGAAAAAGEWEYKFLKVEDKFYKDIQLRGAEFVRKQTVHERGDARWRNAEKGKTVHSCEGETVQVELELSGTAPWDVAYSVVGQPPILLSGLASSPHLLDVAIPAPIAAHGGSFSLSLESVQDGNGCKRPLAAADLAIEVRRTKPTARFHGAGVRKVVMKEGESAKIPLRLTGEGPWTVVYRPPSRRSGTPIAPITFRAQQANVDINIASALPGTYKLLSVKDQFCPGDVFETEWSVETLPRPSLKLGDNIGKIARSGSVVRKGVCANVADSFPVYFNGKAPFRAAYLLSKSGGETKEHTLQAIQSRADLTLFTASPGRHSYHFTGVGDSIYTTPEAAGLSAPQGGKNGILKVEQDVFALPTAFFSQGPKHGFCLHDELASRGNDDLILHLTGTAPFEVELEVKEAGQSQKPKRFTVPSIKGHEWPVSLPIALNKATSHSISVKRVKDANGCETLVDPSSSSPSLSSTAGTVATLSGDCTSVAITVSEIATITPVESRTDHCVGDLLSYVVQGSPPFTVKTEFEGKQHTVPLKSGKYERVAAKPGVFKILSVGQGEEQCKSNQVDIVKHIHPLPSARVRTGESYVVDLREGESTEVVFSFSGTPPFSFTYSRRAPQDRSKDRTVLETHTVTGIQETQYSIFTSQEGTWSVSYVADAFCSFPPPAKSAVVKA